MYKNKPGPFKSTVFYSMRISKILTLYTVLEINITKCLDFLPFWKWDGIWFPDYKAITKDKTQITSTQITYGKK